MNPKTKKEMKLTYRFLSIAALFAAGALTIGCNSLKEELDIPEEIPAPDKTVTLTATVGLDATTKALDATGKKTFAVDDRIAVIYKQDGGATALALSNKLIDTDIREEGQKADITVTLNNPATDGAVRYIYPASMALTTVDEADPIDDAHTIDFSKLNTQDGTLATLAANYDLAVFDGTLNGLKLPGSALLSNQLAIGEFTVKNGNGTVITTDLTSFTVTDGSNTYTITPTSPATNLTGPIYVAMLPVADSQELTFTATDGTTDYKRTITGKTLAKNNMYPVNLKMNRLVVLDNVTTTDGKDQLFLAAQNGDIISRCFSSGYGYITVPDGATVTLDGVNINSPIESDHAVIHCLGSANIILNGNNEVHAGGSSRYPAILAAHNDTGSGEEFTLTISGTGSLYAYGNHSYAAGIGGGNRIPCGNIVISGGQVSSTGGQNGAGIGSGNNSSCGDITISGGQVSSTGGQDGAGIGSGNFSSCGDITISGGCIGIYDSYADYYSGGAIGGENAAGIGCGHSGRCRNITITDGIDYLVAVKNDSQHNNQIDIIGAESLGTCGTVIISGKTMSYDELIFGVTGRIDNLYSFTSGLVTWLLSSTQFSF